MVTYFSGLVVRGTSCGSLVSPSLFNRCGSYTPECLATRGYMLTSFVEWGSKMDCCVDYSSEGCMKAGALELLQDITFGFGAVMALLLFSG